MRLNTLSGIASNALLFIATTVFFPSLQAQEYVWPTDAGMVLTLSLIHI